MPPRKPKPKPRAIINLVICLGQHAKWIPYMSTRIGGDSDATQVPELSLELTSKVLWSDSQKLAAGADVEFTIGSSSTAGFGSASNHKGTLTGFIYIHHQEMLLLQQLLTNHPDLKMNLSGEEFYRNGMTIDHCSFGTYFWLDDDN